MKARKISAINYILILCLTLVLVSGCASNQGARHEAGLAIIPAQKPVSKFVKKDVVYPRQAYDPWECLNRNTYIFNYYVDKYMFLPVVAAYEWVTPDYLEERISSFFNNFSELNNFTNNLLQLKIKGTAVTTGRIIVNSTVGLAGMYDPATKWGMPEHNEDFGQTLGHYGVGAGPYLVLPFLGPSTLRDGTGLAVDATVRWLFWDWVWDEGFENVSTGNESKIRWGLDVLEAIDARHNISFRYYQSGSPFEYDLIRLLYLEHRKLEIAR